MDNPQIFKDPNRAFARLAAPFWNIDPDNLEHVADRGNSVYRGRLDGDVVYLRLTNPDYRAKSELQGELDFVEHLHQQRVKVAAPLWSFNQHLVETVENENAEMYASVFQNAVGDVVQRGDGAWNEAFFRKWGQRLGEIHRAATTFQPKNGRDRWQWPDEYFFRHADRLFPPDDDTVRQEYTAILEYLEGLPKNSATYGMTHADFAPGNFHYDPAKGITAFDFGNCCYHWFLSDIAISLSIILWLPKAERDQNAEWLLAGYRSVFPLNDALFAEISWFLRLRMVYVYLSRLWYFGEQPTPDQQTILTRLRNLVLKRICWEDEEVGQSWRTG